MACRTVTRFAILFVAISRLALAATVAIEASAVPECTVTRFLDVANAVKTCTNIVLDSLIVPADTILDLSKLQQGTVVTFVGTTTFVHGEEDVDLIQIGGSDITIQGAEGAVLDGNGASWWDGLGSNGGDPKPNHFIAVKKALGNSVIQNLYILNFPVHCFFVTGSRGLLMQNIILNNTQGDAPNEKSEGLAAAHNTDGFGYASSDDIILRDSQVWNQDDCVAITSGNNITVSNVYCYGGHGLSIGSVGGKSNNTVTNITFQDSVVENQTNALRIKTNSDTTGLVKGIAFQNIRIINATKYGLDIQQDYLNGGPTGKPTSGVKIQDVTIVNVTGTVTSTARNYYLLCGKESCSNFHINNVKITGGAKGDYCNVQWLGDFSCPSLRPANLS